MSGKVIGGFATLVFSRCLFESACFHMYMCTSCSHDVLQTNGQNFTELSFVMLLNWLDFLGLKFQNQGHGHSNVKYLSDLLLQLEAYTLRCLFVDVSSSCLFWTNY